MRERLTIALLNWLLAKLVQSFEEYLASEKKYDFFEDALSNYLSQYLPIISQFQESHGKVTSTKIR